jgi:RHS repeat-associated protein
VRLSTDANGNKIGEQGHYPYGEAWYASNATTKFIFTSYERDAESGSHYAMARFYINRFGRFSCVDPLLGRPGDPQTWNRYADVRNNPINNVDPSGMGFLSFLANFFKMLLSIFTGGKFGWSMPSAGTPPIFRWVTLRQP